ncbi:signal peptidase I [Gordonibacter sp. An230]|nr:signal peptidase I [Gordonibacter sp. An230]OUO89558.1 signal peptidase I [Gordonibacter sp. An230]
MIFESIFLFAAVALCFSLLQVFVFRVYLIPSGSMETTVMTDDRIVAEKVSYYFRDVEPSDIVVFEDPEIPGRTLLKRCIAVEGQTVELQNGEVIVDGKRLVEPYTHGKPTEELQSDITYPYTVPEGCIWVMGDNRTNSQDSRYFGAVPVSSVQGHAVFRYWPLSSIGVID